MTKLASSADKRKAMVDEIATVNNADDDTMDVDNPFCLLPREVMVKTVHYFSFSNGASLAGKLLISAPSSCSLVATSICRISYVRNLPFSGKTLIFRRLFC